MHYGALDAVCLVHILDKLEEMAKTLKKKGVAESAQMLNLEKDLKQNEERKAAKKKGGKDFKKGKQEKEEM